jgi:hypothetical protein
MLVTTSFPGDHFDKLAWLQHDVYVGHDTGILNGWVWRSLERYRYAERLCQTQTPLGERLGVLAARRGHDHRVIQDAHDLIAAWYRCRCRPWLPLFDPIFDATLERDLWLACIEREVLVLLDDSSITRAVLTAVAYENTTPGYAAEDELVLLLMGRYQRLFMPRAEVVRGCLDECCPPDAFPRKWRGRAFPPEGR